MSVEVFPTAVLREAEKRFSFRFPPDVFKFLQRQAIPGGYDWGADHERIQKMLDWPLEGILFDVEESGLWWPEWGERPSTETERAAVVSQAIARAPRLIPLFGHRYVPEVPHDTGNPVFSVYQSDIIFYGTNVHDWFRHEFDQPSKRTTSPPPRIDFWTLMVERNGDNTFHPFRDWPSSDDHI